MFALYALLGALGVPTFYDKLLCVPLLNLLVPFIDRLVTRIGERPVVALLGLQPPLGHRNLAHMAVWIVFFGVMTLAGRTDGMHRGDALPFWVEACAANRPQACQRMLRIEGSYCTDNAGWACNELGRHYLEGRLVAADADRAQAYFARACEGRFQAGCVNLLDARTPAARQPTRLRPAAAGARRRPESRRHARARAVRARVPPRLGVRVRQGVGGAMTTCRRRLSHAAVVALLVTSPGAVTEARQAALAAAAPAATVDLGGFVEIPGGPFAMGTGRVTSPEAFDNERWSTSADEGTVEVPTFYLGAPRGHGGGVRRLRPGHRLDG